MIHLLPPPSPPQVKLHQTSTERADEFLQKHIGTLVYPPSTPERLAELGPFESHEFEIQGEGWKTSCVDIVISGLGWISVTGALNCKVSKGGWGKGSFGACGHGKKGWRHGMRGPYTRADHRQSKEPIAAHTPLPSSTPQPTASHHP